MFQKPQHSLPITFHNELENKVDQETKEINNIEGKEEDDQIEQVGGGGQLNELRQQYK